MRIKRNIKISIIALGIVFALSTISNFNIIDNQWNNEGTIENRNEANFKRLKKSGYWSTNFIHIDGNWSHTVNNYPWCSGAGSWGNPYTIEKVTIDASSSPTGSGIFIDNSKNDYFVIRNCTIFNAGTGVYDGGIKLENTNNGTLSNNNCSNNLQNGIFLFYHCENNTISGNTANNNDYGIYISYECDNNTISGNLIKDNQNNGLTIATDDSQNNLIYYNSFIGTIGWHANDSGTNNYWDNSMTGNYWDDWYSPDANNDGIVDIPYSLIGGSAGSVDNFPLTETPLHLGEIIHIDDSGMQYSWSKTSRLKFWCTGSGTYSDPFIIDGLEIDAGESGSCILIENSNIYFIIRNCKVYNASSGSYDAGIKLYNTNNGTLKNNDCLNNSYCGIYLYSDCDDNIILENSIHYNNQYGVILDSSCDFNLLYLNEFIGNENNSQDEGNNQWDDGYTGNYWDNYSGSDSFPPDGIGDDPYNVFGDVYDTKPLMYPIFEDTDSDRLNNLEEYTIGDDGYLTNPVDPDTDDDLFNDGDEAVYKTNPLDPLWYPMPNLKVSHFFAFFLSNEKFMLNFSITNNGIWKAQGVIIIIRCEELDLTFFNNTNSPLTLDVDETEYMAVSFPTFGQTGTFTLNLTLDPDNTIAETYSYKDGSARIDAENDNSQTADLTIILETLNLAMISLAFSTNEFNISFFIYDDNGQYIDSATIQMWWNGTDVSIDVQNLGNGLYFVSLEPITVAPGEDPILLNITISAFGFEDNYFETYLAVDPETLEKGVEKDGAEFPFIILIIAILSVAGGIGATTITIGILRKRKPTKIVI